MHGLSFLLYRQMSPQCTFNTGGLWQRQRWLLVLFRLVLQDLLHSQPSDWLSLTEKHSIFLFLIQKFLNRTQVYFMLPTPESIPVMAGNYCVSAPRGRKSRMRNSWDCPFNLRWFWLSRNQEKIAPSRARAWFEEKRFGWLSVNFFVHWPIRMLASLPFFAFNYLFTALC